MDNETLQALLSEEEIRQEMSELKRRSPQERERFRKAMEALRQVEHRAYLAVAFMEYDLLKSPDAKRYLETAKANSTKLIKEDKQAIQGLEIEAAQIEYDLAKFDCETTDKEYDKLKSISIHYQSDKKFTGPTERA
jgi:hypothetical protein